MAERGRTSYLESHQVSNESYQSPTYAFAVLYLLVASIVVYLNLLRSSSSTPAWYENFWGKFCFTITWPVCVFIEICTFSFKSLTGNDDGGRSICGSLLSSPLIYIQLWNWIVNHTSLRKLWFSQQENKLREPPGLGNLDNSCYQNAVIQALASLPIFEKFLAELAEDDWINSNLTTISELRLAVSALNKPSNAGRRLWVSRKLRSMNTWQQQDAQEYFSKIMEHLEKEIKLSYHFKMRTGFEQTKYIMDGDMCEKQAETYGRSQYLLSEHDTYTSENSIRYACQQSPVDGLLAQRVGCKECNLVEDISLIPFNCITVPLGTGPVCDIRDCLNEYTMLETVDGVNCDRCTLLQEKNQLHEALIGRYAGEPPDEAFQNELRLTINEQIAEIQNIIDGSNFADKNILKKCRSNKDKLIATSKTRQTVIARPPRELVIHINRSIYDEIYGVQHKNFAKVRFPMNLDLQPWILGQSPDGVFGDGSHETWSTNPNRSLLDDKGIFTAYEAQYSLRAVISHFGRHENGHYVCYRKCTRYQENKIHDENNDMFEKKEEKRCYPSDWWRLSDDNVSLAGETDVIDEGCAFMLFYESINSYKMHHGDTDATNMKGLKIQDPTINDNAARPESNETHLTDNNDQRISEISADIGERIRPNSSLGEAEELKNTLKGQRRQSSDSSTEQYKYSINELKSHSQNTLTTREERLETNSCSQKWSENAPSSAKQRRWRKSINQPALSPSEAISA